MKRISKRDLITLKAGLAYYERDPESSLKKFYEEHKDGRRIVWNN